MLVPKLVLRKMACSLRSKTDDQLKGLLSHYENQLSKVNDENFKKPINQKIELIKQEISHREKLNNSTLTN